ncbi:MAG: GAF domain-containing protein [Halioglobus sp.]|nr:GAF domain-containing protein [Halioglobus sp.]
MADPDYELLAHQLDALTANEIDALANTANFVALLWQALPNINWLGVYVLRGNDLVLGPFQGNPACVRIPLQKGVCGAAASRRRSLRIANVDEFQGHVACDAKSRSELVVPLIVNDLVAGVLDIDSPHLSRFTAEDQAGIEMLCRDFSARLESRGQQAFI